MRFLNASRAITESWIANNAINPEPMIIAAKVATEMVYFARESEVNTGRPAFQTREGSAVPPALRLKPAAVTRVSMNSICISLHLLV